MKRIGELAVGAFKDAALEGKEKAEELIHEPTTASAQDQNANRHRSLWNKLFRNARSSSTESFSELATQPILSTQEHRALRRLRDSQAARRKYSDADLYRYVASLSNITLTNNDLAGYYSIEFRFGVGFQDYCVRNMSFSSPEKHIPMVMLSSEENGHVTTPYIRCATNSTQKFDKTWQGDWRGSENDFKQESLGIYIWRKEWQCIRRLVGHSKISLEDIALGDTDQTIAIPTTRNVNSIVSFNLVFSELYTFEISVDVADIDLTNCPDGRAYESFRFLMSMEKGKGAFPLTDGFWVANKSATLMDVSFTSPPPSASRPSPAGPLKLQPTMGNHLKFDEPGRLLWRGQAMTFADLELSLELEGKYRIGDWEPYATVQIPCHYLLASSTETFNKRSMGCTFPDDKPVISCTLGLPHRPALQQAQVSMLRSHSAGALKIKVKGISGVALTDRSFVYSVSTQSFDLFPQCCLGSRVQEPNIESVQTFADIKRSSHYALQGLPPEIFSKKNRLAHPLRRTPDHAADEDLSPLLADNPQLQKPNSETIVQFENWLHQRLLIIYLWQTESIADKQRQDRGARKSLGFSILRMVDVVSSILHQCHRNPQASNYESEFTISLLVYGTSWRKSGVEMTLGIGINPLPNVPPLQTRISTTLKKALPSVLPPFIYPDHLGQPKSLFSFLELSTLPHIGDGLTAYDIGRTVRISDRQSEWIMEPRLCLYEGIGNARDIATLVTSINCFNGFECYLGVGFQVDHEVWFTVELRDTCTWWWTPGNWSIEVVPTDPKSEQQIKPELRNALFPGGHKIVKAPSFVSSIQFLINPTIARRGFSHDLSQIRKGVDMGTEKISPATVESSLLSSRLDITCYASFTHVPMSPSNWSLEELREVERSLASNIGAVLQSNYNMVKVLPLCQVLEFLLEAYCSNDNALVTSILKDLYAKQYPHSDGDLKLFCYEAPTIESTYWDSLVQSEMADVCAAKYAISAKIVPCNIASRALTKIIILLFVRNKDSDRSLIWDPRERIGNCPALRPTGDPETDVSLVKDFVASLVNVK